MVGSAETNSQRRRQRQRKLGRTRRSERSVEIVAELHPLLKRCSGQSMSYSNGCLVSSTRQLIRLSSRVSRRRETDRRIAACMACIYRHTRQLREADRSARRCSEHLRIKLQTAEKRGYRRPNAILIRTVQRAAKSRQNKPAFMYLVRLPHTDGRSRCGIVHGSYHRPAQGVRSEQHRADGEGRRRRPTVWVAHGAAAGRDTTR
jgi:hypothetical protein